MRGSIADFTFFFGRNVIEWYENDREDNLHMDINQKLTEELGVKRWQVDAAVKLIDEGNTIPFISRYRKEVTGSLNDEQA